MKKETINKIEDEIEKKTTMPDDLKEKTRKEIWVNILFAIGIMVYITLLILGSTNSTKATRATDFKVFSIVLLFTSICLFEVAYKKDNGKLALYGVEILIVAICTLFLPYIVFELNSTYQRYYTLSTLIVPVYYIIKSIVIKNKNKSLYEKQESDIKEITKKEKRKEEYLDEEIEENKTPKKRGRPRKAVK